MDVGYDSDDSSASASPVTSVVSMHGGVVTRLTVHAAGETVGRRGGAVRSLVG